MSGHSEARPQVWSASYAGVEVFQQLYNGTAVMRRRKDSFVNVTQILKCAQYDKPHRTRFLEREIHTGIHEKVQGGYGKYQGTWVPLDRAIGLARRLNVYEALSSLFEYNPAAGEKPPTAPRSLESMHKRKQQAGHGGGKRRAAAKENGAGSLTSILNTDERQQAPAFHSAYARKAAGVASTTPNTERGWPLRDISSAYQAQGRGGGLMTPPSSLVRRTGQQQRGPPATPTIKPPPFTYTRPPALVSPVVHVSSATPESIVVTQASPGQYLPSQQPSPGQYTATQRSPGQYVSSPDSASPAEHPQSAPATQGHAQARPQGYTQGQAQGYTQGHTQGPTQGLKHIHSAPMQSEAGRLAELITRGRGGAGREVEQSVQRGRCDANARVGTAENTLLHVAVQSGQWDAVQALVVAGADVGLGNRVGVTALMMACGSAQAWRQRTSGVFEWLVSRLSASLVRRDKDGRTAVHWACMRPAQESAAEGMRASHHYVRILAQRLAQSGQREVLEWQNYAGRRAEQIARAAGFDETAAELAKVTGSDLAGQAPASDLVSQAPTSDSARKAPAESVNRGAAEVAESPEPRDRYSELAARAASVMRTAAADMRREHAQEKRQVDEDTRYAATLLLELRAERDTASAAARDEQMVTEQCAQAAALEKQLQRKIEGVVNLQQGTRHVTIGRAESLGDLGDLAEMLDEYRAQRAQAQAYERSSQQLAREFAGLVGVVSPWARAPPRGLVELFADPGQVPDAEEADVQAIARVLRSEEQRLAKLERVVAAACGDLPIDRVRTVVGPVLSVLNNGNTL
ncbi:Transcription factor mbp1 [Coemansia sp. RSA 1199]|nr:Transcription factor mbp1 [Coemansia sp. RSA 1199]